METSTTFTPCPPHLIFGDRMVVHQWVCWLIPPITAHVQSVPRGPLLRWQWAHHFQQWHKPCVHNNHITLQEQHLAINHSWLLHAVITTDSCEQLHLAQNRWKQCSYKTCTCNTWLHGFASYKSCSDFILCFMILSLFWATNLNNTPVDKYSLSWSVALLC